MESEVGIGVDKSIFVVVFVCLGHSRYGNEGLV